MNSARFLVAWLLFLGLAGVGRPAETPADPRPNLVLVVADDLGLTLGCYGDPSAHPLSFPFASDLHGSATWQQTLASGAERCGQRRVQDYLQRPQWEFYDLSTNPGEIHNLAADPAHQATLRELQGRLRRFQEETKDFWMVKYVHE